MRAYSKESQQRKPTLQLAAAHVGHASTIITRLAQQAKGEDAERLRDAARLLASYVPVVEHLDDRSAA